MKCQVSDPVEARTGFAVTDDAPAIPIGRGERDDGAVLTEGRASHGLIGPALPPADDTELILAEACLVSDDAPVGTEGQGPGNGIEFLPRLAVHDDRVSAASPAHERNALPVPA